jgi:hypothetical protein
MLGWWDWQSLQYTVQESTSRAGTLTAVERVLGNGMVYWDSMALTLLLVLLLVLGVLGLRVADPSKPDYSLRCASELPQVFEITLCGLTNH